VPMGDRDHIAQELEIAGGDRRPDVSRLTEHLFDTGNGRRGPTPPEVGPGRRGATRATASLRLSPSPRI
jgi:hypothetical protein